MAITRELIAAVAQAFHGRTGIDEATLTETAERVTAFLGKVRLADEHALQAIPPAFSFDPGAPPFATAPQVGERLWAEIARSQGGTGYGGASGTTGVTAAAPVPQAPTATADGPEFLRWPATRLAAAIRRRELSPVEVTRTTLERIAAVDKRLNAFVSVMADEAMAAAHTAEAQPAGAEKGPLHGVPVVLKDLYETAGVRTTGGSRILADYIPTADGTAVQRLKAAGAIIIGKTATHEFAFGPTTDSPFHGPVRNPWNPEHIPGGSSGGSGAAVAANLVPIAMGTDTGGSIRMPASACGIVGLKPTYGRVSKAGILPLSWSLDHAGPLTRTVADAALVLGVIAGPDPLDPSALPVPVPDYLAAAQTAPVTLNGVRIGVPEGWLDTPVDPEVLALFEGALERLRHLGAEVVSIPFPEVQVLTFVNRLLTLAEAGAYHAPLLKEHATDYAPDVRQRLELAAHVSARDYLVGQRLRTELARQAYQAMAQVDALATPTLAIPPARIGQAMWTYAGGGSEPVAEAMVRFPAALSVTGQPAFSLPCGFTTSGLPVGLQLAGRVFGETELIRIAATFEAAR